ncbi:uncharacterized protein BJX67DRAFT_388830 [Aspergillus lucknowensis]|uniref:DUF7492 domain-containing protein n=1 Tax=Aspergillus lucknowensis TaxID=176173 RepID=A0ABR4LNP6_9EURO
MWILLFVAVVLAHSWVEDLSVVGNNGIKLGRTGYPRGNIRRLDPAFNDAAMTYLLPTVGVQLLPNDPICAPSQRQSVQTPGSPMLQAAPGDLVRLRYQENGHVTLPYITPGKLSPGHVYVYGTSSPSAEDTLVGIHKVWNLDGTGGDRRGRLLGMFDFDDGRCFQVNDGPISRHRQDRYGHQPDPIQGADLWCQNVIRIPDAAGDILTIYWVWDWPSYLGEEGEKQEIYTTCIDIEIKSHEGPKGCS